GRCCINFVIMDKSDYFCNIRPLTDYIAAQDFYATVPSNETICCFYDDSLCTVNVRGHIP
ncbi:MAG: hypothetical protein K2J66_05325, partial [Muribaculaceae bacterium]|nr:hypothetical protein [Muribaculaceae bacterium]